LREGFSADEAILHGVLKKTFKLLKHLTIKGLRTLSFCITNIS